MNTSRGRVRLRAAAIASLAVALCTVPVRQARASCMWLPPPSPVPAVPADGETGVPTNASLWFMTRGGGSAVEIEGAEAAKTASFIGWERWSLTGLEPGETITWTLTLTGDEAHTFGPYTFQVGDTAAEAPATPTLDHAEAVPEDEIGTLCDKAMQMTDCIDTGPNTYVRVHVDPQQGVVLYGICDEAPDGQPCEPRHLIRSSCPATTFIHEGQLPRCFRVTAYNQALGSEPLVTCIDAETPGEDAAGGTDAANPADTTAPTDTAVDGSASAGSEGCRSSTSPLWSGLGLVMVGLWTARRRRQKA